MRLGQGKNLPVIMKCWAGAVKAPVKGKQQKQIPKPWQIKPGFSEGSCSSSSRRVSGALVLPGAAACSEPCPAAAAQLCSHAAPLPGCSCSGPQQNTSSKGTRDTSSDSRKNVRGTGISCCFLLLSCFGVFFNILLW